MHADEVLGTVAVGRGDETSTEHDIGPRVRIRLVVERVRRCLGVFSFLELLKIIIRKYE